MNPALLGVLRTLFVVVILAVVGFFADASHLNGIVSEGLAALIAAVALAIEHAIEGSTGNALFGAVKGQARS